MTACLSIHCWPGVGIQSWCLGGDCMHEPSLLTHEGHMQSVLIWQKRGVEWKMVPVRRNRKFSQRFSGARLGWQRCANSKAPLRFTVAIPSPQSWICCCSGWGPPPGSAAGPRLGAAAGLVLPDGAQQWQRLRGAGHDGPAGRGRFPGFGGPDMLWGLFVNGAARCVENFRRCGETSTFARHLGTPWVELLGSFSASCQCQW